MSTVRCVVRTRQQAVFVVLEDYLKFIAFLALYLYDVTLKSDYLEVSQVALLNVTLDLVR